MPLLSGLGERRQEILRLLLRNQQGLTVDELADRLSITRSGVHQHLNALQRDEYVRRDRLTKTGGRPGHTYVLTDEGVHLFPKQYSWFSELLLESLKEKIGRDALVGFLRELGRKAAAGLAARLEGKPLPEQIIETAQIMRELGYQAEARPDASGALPIIDARNCVYHDLARDYEEVCQLDLALLETALDRPVEQVECMLRGGHACRFRVLDRDES